MKTNAGSRVRIRDSRVWVLASGIRGESPYVVTYNIRLCKGLGSNGRQAWSDPRIFKNRKDENMRRGLQICTKGRLEPPHVGSYKLRSLPPGYGRDRSAYA